MWTFSYINYNDGTSLTWTHYVFTDWEGGGGSSKHCSMLSITVPLLHAEGHDRGDEKQDTWEGFPGNPQHHCLFVGRQRLSNMAHEPLQSRNHDTWNQWRRKIEVIENAIKCLFDLPSEGNDHPFISDSSTKQALMDVAARVFPDEPEPKSVKIHPTKLAD
jgi:hypothetical protein